MSGNEFTEPVRPEYVSIRTPNRGIAIEGIRVDEDGCLWWDVVPMDDLRISCQLWEGIKQNRVQTTGFLVAVVEEGVGLADICVGPVFTIGT